MKIGNTKDLSREGNNSPASAPYGPSGALDKFAAHMPFAPSAREFSIHRDKSGVSGRIIASTEAPATHPPAQPIDANKSANLGSAIGLGAFALLSVFAHKWTVLAPGNVYDTAQLAISKVLIFAVIGFMLVLAARIFLACKHNAIVNRHRYNALLMFKALADAAGSEERRDIVLTYAASCIFAPQETGYSKTGDTTAIVPGAIQSIPKFGGAEN